MTIVTKIDRKSFIIASKIAITVNSPLYSFNDTTAPAKNEQKSIAISDIASPDGISTVKYI